MFGINKSVFFLVLVALLNFALGAPTTQSESEHTRVKRGPPRHGGGGGGGHGHGPGKGGGAAGPVYICGYVGKGEGSGYGGYGK